MTLQPLGDRILVKIDAEKEVRSSGIMLPDTAEKKTKSQGTIVGLGSGEDLAKLNLKEGDKVMFGKYAGDDVELEDVKYKIVSHEDVLAVFK